MWSPDGRLLATGSDDSTVTLWDAATGGVTHVVQEADRIYIRSVAWNPCGRPVLAATGGGIVWIFRASVGH